jgi:hypothetical protein
VVRRDAGKEDVFVASEQKEGRYVANDKNERVEKPFKNES